MIRKQRMAVHNHPMPWRVTAPLISNMQRISERCRCDCEATNGAGQLCMAHTLFEPGMPPRLWVDLVHLTQNAPYGSWT